MGKDYDYVTRTSQNQGVLQTTGFVNNENINSSGNWSLGLLQMDFFYRYNPWYAGQFVRKIIPKINLTPYSIQFFTTILNKLKPKLLSVLVRDVDKTFLNSKIFLPVTKSGKIDYHFMELFQAELESERISNLEIFLLESGFDSCNLTERESQIFNDFTDSKIKFGEFTFAAVFNNIKQGRRLKKDDQLAGNIPFVMAGVTNTGVVNYISNPVASFPKNSITIDIFGNTFYRNYAYGAGDDTGVYWKDKLNYSKESMLFFASAMEKSVSGKFDYGKKLRSSQSFDFKMQLPSKGQKPDFEIMETLISAIKKMVIKDVVLYVQQKKKELKSMTQQPTQ